MGSSRSPRRLPLGLALALAAAGCGAEESLPPPAPASVEPASGFTTGEVAVTIVGEAFYVRASQDADGAGGDAVSATFRAWLGSVELLEVSRVDAGTLTATVPAGVAPGSHDLVVEGPYGRSAPVVGAYDALAGDAPVVLLVGLVADPLSVAAGETARVRATVVNLGPDALTSVKLQLKRTANDRPTAAVPGGPQPRGLAAGEGFGWTYDVATKEPGLLVLELKVTATDAATGAGLPAQRTRTAVVVR